MSKLETVSHRGLYLVGGDISLPNRKRGDNIAGSPYNKVSLGENVEDLNDKRLENRLRIIAQERAIPDNAIPEFVGRVISEIRKAEQELRVRSLPEAPVRDYRRGEDLIEYLRSEEGFAAWIAADALNRPVLRDLAPRAYMALTNYLRRNLLPDDIHIPKKSEVLDTEEISEESVRAARRLLRRAERKGATRD